MSAVVLKDEVGRHPARRLLTLSLDEIVVWSLSYRLVKKNDVFSFTGPLPCLHNSDY